MPILYFIPLILLIIFLYIGLVDNHTMFWKDLFIISIFAIIISVIFHLALVGLKKIMYPASAQTQLSATVKPNACNEAMENAKEVCNKLK